MKTEKEIKEQLDGIKEALIGANNNDQVLILQGFARALSWVITNERADGFAEGTA